MIEAKNGSKSAQTTELTTSRAVKSTLKKRGQAVDSNQTPTLNSRDQAVDAKCGADPRAGLSLLCGYGVEGTPRRIGASGVHGTELRTSCDLEFVCIEAVLSRGKGLGQQYPHIPGYVDHSVPKFKHRMDIQIPSK